MVTREERVKEIIRAKEEKVKAKNTEVAIRHIRRAKEHMGDSIDFLKLSAKFLDLSDKPGWKSEVERAKELLSEANSILVRYDMWGIII